MSLVSPASAGEGLELVHYHLILLSTGGDLGGSGGMVHPKFEVRERQCIRPPNILRTTVIGCEAKYELTKNGL